MKRPTCHGSNDSRSIGGWDHDGAPAPSPPALQRRRKLMVPEDWSQTLTATPLLLIAAGAIALLLFLIIQLRLHAFLALILVSFLTALATGIPFGAIVPVLTDRVRHHPRHRRAARRTRRHARPAGRDQRRRKGCRRHPDPHLRREAGAVRARRRLADVRIPDLLRRRPCRHAAHRLLGGAPARRRRAALRPAGGGRVLRHAHLRPAASGSRRRRPSCSAPTSASSSPSAC